jgi:hypothetical protein
VGLLDADVTRICPNCGDGYTRRWRRFCHNHVWKVPLVPLDALPRRRVLFLDDAYRDEYAALVPMDADSK